MISVNDVITEIEKLAKPQYAYDWDNCGLLAGDRKSQVEKILITLDITKEVALEAKEKNCQMIISHHPLIFKAVKNLSTDTYEGEVLSILYKNNIALYCAHTSLDIASGGVNDVLCEKLMLNNVSLVSEMNVLGETVACARKGDLPHDFSKGELIEYIKNITGAKKLDYYLLDKTYKKIALCTGAGEEFAFDSDADVFLTGEIKYHTALEMKRQNISFIAAGHYFTEVHIAEGLSRYLQKQFNMLQYSVEVIKSETNTNPFENQEDIL